uniref:Integrase catalytic domain-containing protein n=2 Tax=Nephila pilipes TaxID=299642 RepID=A0A8X6NI10_NEPPI|nr:hypothetical protein NPIL_442531 [Nephila pilipes]
MYHTQSNGGAQRFFSQLKRAMISHLPDRWLDGLPFVLLGIWTSYKDGIAASSAEMAYRSTLKLLGEFFSRSFPLICLKCLRDTRSSRYSSCSDSLGRISFAQHACSYGYIEFENRKNYPSVALQSSKKDS